MIDIFQHNSEKLKNYCRENGISKLSVFGSYAKNSFNDDSDIDILVEFEKQTKPGYLTIARVCRELSELLGKKVDLRTPEELSRYFREDTIKEAVVQYVAK